MEKRTKSKKVKIAVLVIFCLIAVLFAGMAIYVNDDYSATDEARLALQSDEAVTVEYLQDDAIVFVPEEPKAALIFYPGGKVDYEAYAPLMHAYAGQGILCILPHMPFGLAVFDSDAAERYRDLYPEIDAWYVGGHSLGGAMAASYLETHVEEYAGLILLAAYSTADLSDTELQVISIYGSNDKVLNREKYEQYRANLPADFSEKVIEGGCHAYFGSYGPQDGDGEPDITNAEQIRETVEFTVSALEL